MKAWKSHLGIFVITTLIPFCCFVIHGAIAKQSGLPEPMHNSTMIIEGFSTNGSVDAIAISTDGKLIATEEKQSRFGIEIVAMHCVKQCETKN